jgi:hypothetical protein
MKYVVMVRRQEFGTVEVEADSWNDAAEKALKESEEGNANWASSFESANGGRT